MTKPHLVLIEHVRKSPTGRCSACPNTVFELGSVGSRDENILALRKLFAEHFQTVHAKVETEIPISTADCGVAVRRAA
jgi:hypothetical protein